VSLVRACCAVAVVSCVALSLACGPAAGLVHLACVAAAWSYNLGLKATVWSWVPYAVAFGLLTVFVALAGGAAAPWWWPVGAALLGVGAHLLNVLPDLDDDAATGVRGLPHVLGPRRIAPVAATVLVTATVVVLVGASPATLVVALAAAVVLALALVVVAGRGRQPFVAAIGIALVDATLLVVAR
jgi:4-hydroxybenzoate polyprenyltransferase